MTPASLNALPVELHTSILKFLLDLTLAEVVACDAPVTTLFPCNAASVCTLWRDILAKMLHPEYWNQIVFDVAHEPALLEAFEWSKTLRRETEVVVYNSSHGTNLGELEKAKEKRRVSSIVQALRPHIGRFKSINFDIKYSSSLPSPTIFFLEEANFRELTLSCRIDDIDIAKESWTTTVNKKRPALDNYFPRLKKLSLTGFWFMYLALQAPNPEWFRELQDTLWPLNVTISNFNFLHHGHYTLPNLIFFVSQLNFSQLTLRNLTLGFEYTQTSPMNGNTHINIFNAIHFEGVSKDFIAHLYAIAKIPAPERISFERCEIPSITKIQEMPTLKLKDIIDDDQGSSLRNILSAWRGVSIVVEACPSLNDAVLSWMGSKIEYTSIRLDNQGSKSVYEALPAREIVNFSIEDCENFTPSALQQLITARRLDQLPRVNKDHSNTNKLSSAIRHLCVSGKVPSLTEEDKEWFNSNSHNMGVIWKGISDGKVREDFYVSNF